MEISERRRAIRLPLPRGSVSGFQGLGRIIDVSSVGMKIEVDTRCVFARGERHRLVVSDPLESVEVEGLVRWTLSNWRDSTRPRQSEYFQTAGLAFSRLLSQPRTGIWSKLLAGMADPAQVEAHRIPPQAAAAEPVGVAPPEVEPVRVEPVELVEPTRIVEPATTPQRVQKRARKTPLVEMLDPIDGSTVDQPTIRVICAIEAPESVSGIRINGVEAFVMGDLGTAEVKLHKGANRILSMVSRRDGRYSTYPLGTITLATDR